MASPRITSVWAQRIGIGLVVALVAAFALRVGTSSSQSIATRDPSRWFASTSTGDVVLAHAGSATRGQVVARVHAANPGERLVVVSNGRGAVVLNATKGEVGQLDPVTQTLSQRTPLAGVDATSRLLWSPAGARVVTTGAVHRLDPATGLPLGATTLEAPLAGVVVDDAGVVYGTDPTGRVLAVTDAVAPVALADGVQPAGLVVAAGTAYLVDRNGPGLVALDGARTMGRSCLSGALPAGAVVAGGSATGTGKPLGVVVDGAGGLRFSEPGGSCSSLALAAIAPGTTFGPPVAAGDLVFLPLLSTAEVVVLSVADNAQVKRYPIGLAAGTPFELVEHDGTVWFDEPNGSAAGVLGRDDVVTRVDKSAPVATGTGAGSGASGGRGSGSTTGPTGGAGGTRVSGASGTPVSGPTGATGGAGAGASGATGGTGSSGTSGNPSGTATTPSTDPGTDPATGPSSANPKVGLVADFTYSSRSVRVGQNVAFADASSGDPTAWTWEFGDGTFTTGPKATHAWAQPGVFTVTLRVENGGASATASVAITVVSDVAKARPEADFRFNSARVEVGQPVTFTDRSTGDPVEWQWSFGDGSGGSGQTITHVYRVAGTYEVTLTVSNAQGSTTSSPARITVFDSVEPPVAVIGGGQATASVGQLVGWFSRSTGNATALQWTFGDGTGSNGPVAQHAWTRAGSYTVTLVVSNSAGSSTATAVITVNDVTAAPVSRFTVSQSTAEEGQALRFQSVSINNPTQLAWDFGDGTSASGATVTHAFARAGSYTVSLRATNSAGTDVSAQSISIVAQLPAPVAAFSFSPDTITTNTPVVFTDETSGGAPTTWSWDFGDGTPSVAQRNPTHVFERTGSYVVRLTVTNGRGTSAAQRTVTVLPAAPEAGFSYSPVAPLAGQRVDFTDTSGGGAPTAWLWNFGDGGTSTQRNPAHTFAANGTYDVRLTVSNATGSTFFVRRVEVNPPAPIASFTFTPAAPTTATPVVFRNTSTGGAASTTVWDFGDGTPTAATPNPSHTYAAAGTYTVRLTLGNTTGTSSSTARLVVTVPAPTASFTATGPALTGSAVTFTNTSTGGPFSAIAWDFGDGGTATTANPTHTFATAGTFNVRLTVTNAGGSTSTTVAVPVFSPITPTFTVGTPRNALQSITFTNTTAGTYSTISWDFGDGGTATGASVLHSYLTPGSYDVKLRLVSSSGVAGETTTTITVGPQVPVAAFTYVAAASPARTVTFTSTSAGAPFTSLTWDFGDGTPTVTGASVTHTFAGAGVSFDVRLTAINPSGTNASTQTIALAVPVASFTTATGATARTIVFTNTSTGGPFSAVSWDFGDGATSGAANPTHAYTAAGTYPVILTVTNANRTVSTTVSVTVP